ncbi:MAG: sigma-70 family RNA polymerase sigma factor [Rubellimicrobium sp.]|nr:sigma-70 family RNA polymerase sigma factor [Rubellimicrobium sp.]
MSDASWTHIPGDAPGDDLRTFEPPCDGRSDASAGSAGPARGAAGAGGEAGADPREVILEHLPALRAFALSLARNPATADDMVQDTVLKAWKKFHLFTPGTNLRAWLFTILRNNLNSQRRKRRREVPDSDGALAARLVSKPDHDGRLALAELNEALAQLPHEQREALILVGAMGFTVEEAAGTCGCAPGTIKSRANRGRRALADMLGLDHASGMTATDATAMAVLAAPDQPG